MNSKIKSDMIVTLIISSLIPIYCWSMYFVNPLHASKVELSALLIFYIVLTSLIGVAVIIRYKRLVKEKINHE